MKVLILLGLFSLAFGLPPDRYFREQRRHMLLAKRAAEMEQFVETLNLLFDKLEDVKVMEKFHIQRPR